MRYEISDWKRARAQEFRENMTPAEKELWKYIRNSKLGFRFSRQKILKGYIADFYCWEKQFVVEVDGGYHKTKEQQKYDKMRTYHFSNIGIKTIRISNELIFKDIYKALEPIKKELGNDLSLKPTIDFKKRMTVHPPSLRDKRLLKRIRRRY